MLAAIYTRYSSDRQRPESIDDQIRKCVDYAYHKDLEIVRTFKDEAISGARLDRPAYQDMLKAAEQREFNTLIVDDLSRLSRDEIEMKTVIRRFQFWGLNIIGVSDGFDSNAKSHKIQASVRGLINEIYLDDLRDKTHRGLTGQALKGYNCGGRVYGYDRVPIEHPSERDEYGRPIITAVTRKINEEQAHWVYKIFEWYANGYSPRWIAAELNKLEIPAPKSGSWCASAIHGDMLTGTGLLNNELYIGLYIWNRSQWIKNPDTGKRKRLIRPESEWIKTDMPELCIVEKNIWQRVKERQQEIRGKSINIQKALHKNARTGAGPKYIFSGLLKCGQCGANYSMSDYYRYSCASHKNRGVHVCNNDLKVSRELVEDKLLATVKSRLFTEDGIAYFRKETVRLLNEHKNDNDIASLQKALKASQQEIDNIMAAIKAGVITASTKAALQQAEEQKIHLQEGIASAQQFDKTEWQETLDHLVDGYKELVKRLEDIPRDKIARIRTAIKSLVGGEIRLIPKDDTLTAEVQGNYAGLLTLKNIPESKLNLVAGVGFKPTTLRL